MGVKRPEITPVTINKKIETKKKKRKLKKTKQK